MSDRFTPKVSHFLNGFSNSHVRTLSLKRRMRKKKEFKRAMKYWSDYYFYQEMSSTISKLGNMLIFIFSPRNTGKSECAQTVALIIVWMWRKAIGENINRLRYLQSKTDNKNVKKNIQLEIDKLASTNFPIKFTRNYRETNQRLAEATDTEILTIIQDEDESLIGRDKEVEMINFINNLKTGRILKHNVIICSINLEERIVALLSFALEVIGQNFARRMNLLTLYDNENEPIGKVRLALHNNTRMRRAYVKWKEECQKLLTKHGGGRSVNQEKEFDEWVDAVYDKTMDLYKGHTNLLDKDCFKIAVLKSGLALSSETGRLVAKEAFTKWKIQHEIDKLKERQAKQGEDIFYDKDEKETPEVSSEKLPKHKNIEEPTIQLVKKPEVDIDFAKEIATHAETKIKGVMRWRTVREIIESHPDINTLLEREDQESGNEKYAKDFIEFMKAIVEKKPMIIEKNKKTIIERQMTDMEVKAVLMLLDKERYEKNMNTQTRLGEDLGVEKSKVRRMLTRVEVQMGLWFEDWISITLALHPKSDEEKRSSAGKPDVETFLTLSDAKLRLGSSKDYVGVQVIDRNGRLCALNPEIRRMKEINEDLNKARKLKRLFMVVVVLAWRSIHVREIDPDNLQSCYTFNRKKATINDLTFSQFLSIAGVENRKPEPRT